MSEDFRRRKFDEDDREAVRLLLEHFWILRDRMPAEYSFVRSRLPHLKHYFLDRYGYRIIDHRHFIKLEKIPATPRAWMGIESLTSRRDYVVLCCLLAFLDERQVDEQFLLSQVCEVVKELYPGEEDADPESPRAPLNWESWEHRKSLVRVLNLAVSRGLVRQVDGQVERFARDAESEVLYEVPVVARYFPISYPQELSRFHTLADLLAGTDHVEDRLQSRRHRLHRELLLTPAFFRHEAEPEDFAYLRSQRNRMRDDFENRTPYRMALSKHTAMLVVHEQSHRHHTFPNKKSITDLILLFAATVRDAFEATKPELDAEGRWPITTVTMENLLHQCREKTAHGWSKAHRELSPAQFGKLLRRELRDWNMIVEAPEQALVYLCPTLVRRVGRYPSEFTAQHTEEGKKTGKRRSKEKA